MAPPFINDYKLQFSLKRIVQTFLGGPILIGKNIPIILIVLQIGLYILPVFEILIVNLIIVQHEHHHLKSNGEDLVVVVEAGQPPHPEIKISYYWKGLIIGVSVLVIDLVLTLTTCLLKTLGRGSSRKKIGPSETELNSPVGRRKRRDDSPPSPPSSSEVVVPQQTYPESIIIGHHASAEVVGTFLAEDDQLEYKGLSHLSTWNYIIPNIFVPLRIKVNSIITHLTSIICSSLAFGLCTPLILNMEISIVLRAFGLFTLCNGRYAAIFHTPFEIATFDTIQQKKDCFYRLFYILIIGFSYLFAWWISETIDPTAFLAILVSLPFLWSLGLLPSLDALFPWLVETILQLFGGSTSFYYFGSFLGILVVIGSSLLVLITDEYFILSVLIQCIFGYVISCDLGLLPRHFSKSSSSICGGSEAMTINKCLTKLLTPFVQILFSLLFVYLGLVLFLKDSPEDIPIISAESKYIVELFVLSYLLLSIGLIRIQQFYCLGIGELGPCTADNKKLLRTQRVLVRFLTAALHFLLTIELGCGLNQEKMNCGADHEDIDEVTDYLFTYTRNDTTMVNEITMLDLSNDNYNMSSTSTNDSTTMELDNNYYYNISSTTISPMLNPNTTSTTTASSWLLNQSPRFKRNTKSLIQLFMYSLTIRSYALGITHPKLTTFDMILALSWKYFGLSEQYRIHKLHFPILLFCISFPRKWILRLCQGLGLFLRILYTTMTSLLIESKLRTFGFTILCLPITLSSILLRSIIDGTSVTPIFILPTFLIGFPRPNSFWKQSWFPFRPSSSSASLHMFRNVRATGFVGDDKNLDYVMYENISEILVQSFVYKIMECGYRLQQGQCFIARFDDRLIFLRVVTVGWNCVYIQMRGLEMQEQTSCHHQEAAWIDEMFDSTPYLKPYAELDPIQHQELNSISFITYYLKRLHHGRFSLRRSMSILNPLFSLNLPTYTESKSNIEALRSPTEKELFKKNFFYSYTYVWISSHLCQQQRQGLGRHGSGADEAQFKLICSGKHLFERRSSVASTTSSMSLPNTSSWTKQQPQENGNNGYQAEHPTIEANDVTKFPYLPGMDPVVESKLSNNGPSTTQAQAAAATSSSKTNYSKNKSKNYTPQELVWIQFLIQGLNDETEIHKIVKITWKVWSMIFTSSSSNGGGGGDAMMMVLDDENNNVINLYEYFEDEFKGKVETKLKTYGSKTMSQLSSEIIIKSFRYAVKLTLDQLYNHDSSNTQDDDETDAHPKSGSSKPNNRMIDSEDDNLFMNQYIFNELESFSKSITFCSYKDVVQAIQSKQTQIITMTKIIPESSNSSTSTNGTLVSQQPLSQLHIFTYHGRNDELVNDGDSVRIYVGQISSAVVEGIWSNLNLELLYLTSDDDERYSIQHDKILLRNIITQCANSPLGYFVYDSIFRLNLLDKLKIQSIDVSAQ